MSDSIVIARASESRSSTRLDSSADTGAETVSSAKSMSEKRSSPVLPPRLHSGVDDVGSHPLKCILRRGRLPKFKRAKPSWRPPLSLDDRDIELMDAIQDFRLLSTPQLFRLFQGSRDTLYQQLQLLFHHGYVDRIPGSPNVPMVYALAARGRQALINAGHLNGPVSPGRRNAGIQARYVAHQAMIADFRITLILAARSSPAVRLLRFEREGEPIQDSVTVERDGRRQRLPVNPDGFFGLQFPDLPEGRNKAFFFVEADRSTMIRERFVQKLVGYWAWFCQGGHTRKLGIKSFRVLTVTKSDERAAGLTDAARGCREIRDGLAHFWFASESRFTSSGPAAILGPVWETPATPGVRRQLLPLARMAREQNVAQTT